MACMNTITAKAARSITKVIQDKNEESELCEILECIERIAAKGLSEFCCKDISPNVVSRLKKRGFKVRYNDDWFDQYEVTW